jgi:hypothetical protein
LKPIKRMTQAEVGAFVQGHLSKKGIEVVLSGGASVAIYSGNTYVSKDLDLVNVRSAGPSAIKAAMEEIGFHEEGRYFRHPDSEIIVEFPPGPLAVGTEPVKTITEITLSTGNLRVISPTDCVKDRLAAFYHWQDRQALSQALMVARHHEVDLAEIARWSEVEGMQDEFQRIEPALISART